MRQTHTAKITGIAPLLMHNGQTADPLNHYAKLKKEISGKRNKTDADLEELARIDWFAGLYVTDGVVVLPGRVLEAALVNAARKVKKGKQALAGLYVDRDFPLEYDGPADIEKLSGDERFKLISIVRIGTSRIAITRPMFFPWSATVEIIFNDEVLNPKEVQNFLAVAGSDVGVGDWRPKFGRFGVV